MEVLVKKTLFTLNLNPADYKGITDLTYPFLKHYAHKCGAEFVEIKERRFPEWPPTYEKLQIYKLGQEMKNDWNIFIDCDALVHPDTPDWTNHLNKDTVAHNGADFAGYRWVYDRFFWRDGRNIGSATWLNIASDWCIELFEPLLDMTPEQVAASIFPIHAETRAGMKPIRLVEDYVMSRNIAKYGLKFIMLIELLHKLGVVESDLFFHIYNVPATAKIFKLKETMNRWGLL